MKTFHEELGYEQRIEWDEYGNFIDYNCTCIFGSVWRFTKNNIKLKTRCKHINFILNGGKKE